MTQLLSCQFERGKQVTADRWIWRCSVCGFETIPVKGTPRRNGCWGILRPDNDTPIELAFLQCKHRDPASIATTTGTVAGVGCDAIVIEFFKCRNFHEPVLKQCAAWAAKSNRDKLTAACPGYAGRTCRECPVPLSVKRYDVLHMTHRANWQDIVHRSMAALSSRGCTITAVELAKATSDVVQRHIDAGARLVINHAFILDAAKFVNLAKRNPTVRFVALNHCSLNHTFRWSAYFGSVKTCLLSLPKVPNLYYGGPDQFSCFRDFVDESVRERVLWWPNPVWIPPVAPDIRPDPARIMLAGRSDYMKCFPAQMVAMALVKKQRPEVEIAVSIAFGEKVEADLKSLAAAIGTKFEWWRYCGSADWYDRLTQHISILTQVSASESFGYNAIDAMGHGRPVVCGSSVRYCPSDWQADIEIPEQTAAIMLRHLDNYEAASLRARQVAERVADSQNTAYAKTIKRLLGE